MTTLSLVINPISTLSDSSLATPAADIAETAATAPQKEQREVEPKEPPKVESGLIDVAKPPSILSSHSVNSVKMASPSTLNREKVALKSSVSETLPSAAVEPISEGSLAVTQQSESQPPAQFVTPLEQLSFEQPPSPPKYPRRSRLLGEEGEVIVSFQTDALGRVQQLSLFSSSGYARLDQAALNAVRQWQLSSSIDEWVRVPIRFQLTPHP